MAELRSSAVSAMYRFYSDRRHFGQPLLHISSHVLVRMWFGVHARAFVWSKLPTTLKLPFACSMLHITIDHGRAKVRASSDTRAQWRSRLRFHCDQALAVVGRFRWWIRTQYVCVCVDMLSGLHQIMCNMRAWLRIRCIVIALLAAVCGLDIDQHRN